MIDRIDNASVRFSRRLRHAQQVDRPSLDASGNGVAHATTGRAHGNNPAEVAARLDELMHHLQEQIDEIEQRRQQSLGELRQLAVELALAATAKVFQQEVEQDRFPIEQIIDAMLANYRTGDAVQVCLHPHDYQLIQQRLSDDPQRWSSDQVAFQSHSDIPPGRCRLESSRFDLFFDPSVAIQQIHHSVLESLHDATIERRNVGGKNSNLQRFPDRRSAH